MPQFMLLLHENPADFQELSPEDMQRIIERYTAWSERLAADGTLVSGIKLRDEGGRHLRAAARRPGAGNGGTPDVRVTDGPYVESKEVVGGLYVVRAPDYDAAVAIARDCPHMANGWIELREIEIM